MAGEDANVEIALARSLVDRMDAGDVRRLWTKVFNPGEHHDDHPASGDWAGPPEYCVTIRPLWPDLIGQAPDASQLCQRRPPTTVVRRAVEHSRRRHPANKHSCSNAEALRTKLATSNAPAGEWWEWEPVGRCLFAPADQLLLCGERGLYGDGTATQSKKDGVQANPCHGAGASDGCRFGHLTSVNTAYPSRAAKSSPFVRGALSGNFSADVSASTARTAVFTWWSSLMRNRGPDR